MNPCPCGYYGDKQRECRCSVETVRRYRQKISGPLLDRIDLHVAVQALDTQTLAAFSQIDSDQPGSATYAAQVVEAYARQIKRQGKRNAKLSATELGQICVLSKPLENFMARAIDRLGLSARAFHRVLRVARTLADLEPDECSITQRQLQEALSFRAVYD